MNYDITELLSGMDPPGFTQGEAPDMANLREAVAKKLEAERGAVPKRRRRLSKTMLIAAALAALLSVTALAAAFNGFGWLRDEVDPPFIDAVGPVEQSITDQGIELSIIASGHCGDSAVIYFSLRDTLGEGRITRDAELLCKIQSAGGYGGSSKPVYYDEESQTAVFEYFLSSSGDLGSKELSLAISGILTGRENLDVRLDGFDLASAAAQGEHLEPHREYRYMLTPGRLYETEELEGAFISAVGTVGGCLAVQLDSDEAGEWEYWFLRPYLLSPDGQRVDYIQQRSGSSYVNWDAIVNQYLFEMDTSALDGWTLCLEGCRFAALRGDWRLDLDLGKTLNTFETVTDVTAGDTVFEGVTVRLTPFGLWMEGVAELSFVDETYLMSLKASVITEDGEIHIGAPDGSAPVSPLDVNDYYEGKDTLRYYAAWNADSAIDLSSVTAIRIGDTLIEPDS